jgi:hypothetical protein
VVLGTYLFRFVCALHAGIPSPPLTRLPSTRCPNDSVNVTATQATDGIPKVQPCGLTRLGCRAGGTMHRNCYYGPVRPFTEAAAAGGVLLRLLLQVMVGMELPAHSCL